MIKRNTLVLLDDVTPNRATVTAVGDSAARSERAQLLYWCPEHGAEPAVGDRIHLGHICSRPRCCAHTA